MLELTGRFCIRLGLARTPAFWGLGATGMPAWVQESPGLGLTLPYPFSVLLHTATANGFQMVTSGVQSKAVSDWLITSVEVSARPCVPH